MAGYKRVVLTERDNFVKETVAEKSGVNTVKKQLEKFDNSYTSKKLNELYSEFDAITFDTPSISSTTITHAESYAEKASAVSYKTKLYLASALLITLLLSFLAIYNIFVINGLNSGIKLLQEEVTTTEYDYQTLYDYYKQLKNLNNITEKVNNNGFGELSSNSIVNISLVETQNVEHFSSSTNWFDQLCDFIRGMFGG